MESAKPFLEAGAIILGKRFGSLVMKRPWFDRHRPDGMVWRETYRSSCPLTRQRLVFSPSARLKSGMRIVPCKDEC